MWTSERSKWTGVFWRKIPCVYQWFPFGPEHGMKHWAHVISEDLVKWEWSDQMLIPDQEYEKMDVIQEIP